jgi:5-methyltetrahydropteroyltriglutamate--homocysteine methyltransferase
VNTSTVKKTASLLTTHVGSLPRSEKVVEQLFSRERGEAVDEPTFNQAMDEAVDAVVKRQVESGIDLVSDGEMSKISYATYIKDRYTGFEGDSPRRTPADLLDFPGFMNRASKGGGTPTYRRPCCVGPIALKDESHLKNDIERVKRAAKKFAAQHVFMNSPSPGTVSLFQPNKYYASDEHYLEALASALRIEYQQIVDSGLILQIDSPDLGLGRHMMFKEDDDASYLSKIALHIEALNYALAGIDPAQIRMHICWGNYEGPHHKDVDLEMILPTVLKVQANGLLFEAANPRHAHEWETFEKMKSKIPQEKILIPGVIDSTSNFIEHPRLIAQRLEKFINIVGGERVIAGSDCGFGTFAGFGAVDSDIVYAKLSSMKEGALMALSSVA